MIKPIIEKEEINFYNLFSFIIHCIKKNFLKSFIGVAFFILSFFFGSPEFTTSVTFYTNYSEEKDSSFLNVLSRGFSGSSNNNLNFSITDYMQSDKFLQDVVSNEYLVDEKIITLIDLWGTGYDKVFSFNPLLTVFKINTLMKFSKFSSDYDRKSFIAKKYLSENISYEEDPDTNLHTISITSSQNQILSKMIIENIYLSLLKYSNEVTELKANEKKNFISGRLYEVKKKLTNAEESLIEFLSKNKNTESPKLIIEKDRLEREIILYTQLSLTLSDQYELASIEEKDNTSSLFVLDEPKISTIKSGMSLLKGTVYYYIFFMILFSIHYSYKKRNELIIL